MKNVKLVLFILATVVFATSCDDRGNNGLFNCIKGEGDVVTQDLLINEFKSVKLRGSSEVFITQGSPFQVTVEGQQNIIDNIETDIQNDRWEIEFEDCMKDYTTLKFYITMPNIQKLEVSGSGKIKGENDFDVNEINLEVDGSGFVNVAVIDAASVDARISGSGRIEVEGVSDYLGSKVSGSGNLKAFDLDADICNIKISGSGDADVSANDELKVKITGSGDVYYKGTPTIDVSITGSGDLVDAN